MNPTRIIGVVGLAGHGKDTFAAGLYPLGYRRVAYADILKRAVQMLFGFSDAQVNGTTAEKEAIDQRWGISPRWAMQQMGTEVGREGNLDVFEPIGILRAELLALLIDVVGEPGHRDIWVGATLVGVKAYDEKVVVTDVRFHNEAQAIRDRGGIIVRVANPRLFRQAEDKQHASETEQTTIACDFLVQNNAEIEDLHAKARGIVGTWQQLGDSFTFRKD